MEDIDKGASKGIVVTRSDMETALFVLRNRRGGSRFSFLAIALTGAISAHLTALRDELREPGSVYGVVSHLLLERIEDLHEEV